MPFIGLYFASDSEYQMFTDGKALIAGIVETDVQFIVPSKISKNMKLLGIKEA